MKINKSSSETYLNSEEEKVKILFYDETSLEYNKDIITSMSITLLDDIPKCKEYYIIRAPYGITKNDFLEFMDIYSKRWQIKPGEKHIGNDCKKLFPILKLMEFFGNEYINVQVITYIILPEINSNIAIDLIIFSYDKLCYFSEKGREANDCYFELFYNSLEELSKDEMMIIRNIDKLISLDIKIIEELMQKTFRNLIFGKYFIERNDNSSNNNNESALLDVNQNSYFDENELQSKDFNNRIKREDPMINIPNKKIITTNNLKHLISILIKKNNLDNIFSLLTKEYMSLLSSESISELQNMPNPSFQVKIPLSIYENYYEEFPLDININNQLITLVIFYKISDKSINACIKLASRNKEKNKILNKDDEKSKYKYSFDILTLLTNVTVTKGQEKKIIAIQNNLTSMSNNKSMYSILKIPHFNSEIINNSNTTTNSYLTNCNTNLITNNDNSSLRINNEKQEEYIFIIFQIRLCYIYSVLSSYLLQDFDDYANDKNISKLSKQLFVLLIKNQKLNKKNENNLIKSILLWLDDEINIKEDISEVFYLIKWEEIEDDLIFELLIKYSHIILNDENLENFFLEIYLNKFCQNKNLMVGNTVEKAVEKVVLKLFKAMKKIEYHKLFGQVKKDEKIIENYRTFKIKSDINLRQSSKKILKKNECEIKTEKKYCNEYTQTEPSCGSRKGSPSLGEKTSYSDKKKTDNFFNMVKAKNLVKNKSISQTPSTNNFSSKTKRVLKKDKIVNNEIPKSKQKSSKSTQKSLDKSNNKIIDKIINKSKENHSPFKPLSFKSKERNLMKNSKSIQDLSYKKERKDNINKKIYNISVVKKSDSRIKEMLIFPYNFSVLKKFKNIDNNKNKSKNSHT
jgi:hypothetical protein